MVQIVNMRPGGVGPYMQVASNTATGTAPINPTAPMLLPAPSASPMPSGLLGANPAQTRANAFLRGIGAMAPGLLMAGAPSLDPGNRDRGLALAFQGFQQAQQGALDRARAQNLQNLQFKQAQQKAMMEKAAFDREQNRLKRLSSALGFNTTNPMASNQVASTATPPLGSAVRPTVVPPAVRPPVVPTTVNNNPLSNLNPAQKITIMTAKDPSAALSQIVNQLNNPQNTFIGRQLTPKGKLETEKQYRTELKPIVDKLNEVNRKMRIVKTGFSQGTGSGDVALVTSFIKMIDEGVVTAGELAVQTGAQDLISRMRLFVDNAKEGDVIGEDLRKNLLRLAQSIEQDTYNAYRPTVESYKAGALDLGLDWNKQIWRGGPAIFRTQQTAQSGSSQVQDKKLPVPNINKSITPLHKNLPVPGGKKSG